MFRVVVSHRKEAELVVLLGESPAREGGDQLVLLQADVLVLVNQYPAEARQQPRTVLVRFVRRQSFAAQQGCGLSQYFLEIPFVQTVCTSRETGANQPHSNGGGR